MLANAATRSILEGTDFGDNVLAALPDVIAQTVFDLARFGAGPTQAALARRAEKAFAQGLAAAQASVDRYSSASALDPVSYYGSGPGGASDIRSNPNNPKLPYGLGKIRNQFTEGFSAAYRPQTAQATSLWSRLQQWWNGTGNGQSILDTLSEYGEIVVVALTKARDAVTTLLAPNVKQSIPVPRKPQVTTPAVRPGQQPSFAPFVSPQAQAYFQNSPEPFGALNKSPIEFAGSKLTLDYKQNNAFGGPENPLLAPRGQLYQNKPTTLMQVLAQGYRQNSERPSRSPLARFIGGAIGGDFNDDTSLASTGGKIVGGLNPVSDIRDIAANGGKIWRGEDGGWSGFGWSLVGSIPVVGDGAKAIFKHGDEVVDGIGSLRHGDEAAERGGLEAVYRARYVSGYQRAVVDVDARLASGRLINGTRQPDHLFRANEIDRFARDDLRLFAQAQGHGPDLVRVNQRLYLEGTSGSYRVPDLYFPQSRTIFDGTLGTKTLQTRQIIDFRTATGNRPVGIVNPGAPDGFYWLGK